MIARVKDDNIRDHITVDKTELMRLLGVGRGTAEKIAESAGAGLRVGGRKLYSVAKIEKYINELAESEQEPKTEKEEAKTDWISVRSRLPEINQKVLLCSNKGEVFVGVRDEPNKIWLVTGEDGEKKWAYDPEENCTYWDEFESIPTDYDIGFIRCGECVLSVTSINYNPKFSGVVAWKE